MKSPRYSQDARVSDAVNILGAGAKEDIEIAISMIEAIEVDTNADLYGDWRKVLGDFLRDLEKVQGHIDDLRPRLVRPSATDARWLEDPQVIDSLYFEVAAWVRQVKRKLNHPGIKHQQHYRNARDPRKQEAGLQAWRLLNKHGKPVDGREGRRLNNKLARILYGDEAADLRRYSKPPFVREAVGNVISPFNFR